MDRELHRSGRAGWLRAAVLGADDGIVSTASLVIGVAVAAASQNTVLLAGVAGLVAGATSMAAGEYVSVSSQRDAEQADISQERRELAADPAFEQTELTEIYVRRGLNQELAAIVAERLMAVDPLGSHVRDELGLQPGGLARPLQAAVVSAVSFAAGAALPLALIVLAPDRGPHPADRAGRAGVAGPAGGGWCPAWWCTGRAGGAASDSWRRLGDGPDGADRTAGGHDRTVVELLSASRVRADGCGVPGWSAPVAGPKGRWSRCTTRGGWCRASRPERS